MTEKELESLEKQLELSGMSIEEFQSISSYLNLPQGIPFLNFLEKIYLKAPLMAPSMKGWETEAILREGKRQLIIELFKIKNLLDEVTNARNSKQSSR